jgi:hypothetical protein
MGDTVQLIFAGNQIINSLTSPWNYGSPSPNLSNSNVVVGFVENCVIPIAFSRSAPLVGFFE